RRHAARCLGSAQGYASKYAGQSWPWPALQRAYRGRRPDDLRPCVQDGTRRHRVEAQGLALPLGALAGLAQDEEPGCASGDTGGRGRMGQQEMAMTGKGVGAKNSMSSNPSRKMSAEALYMQIGRLIEEMPDLTAMGPISP